MAVPSSGSISLAGLAAEKENDDYTDVDYDDVLSLKDITIGGNANNNSFVADVTNGFSASHPNNVAPFEMSEFISYVLDEAAPGCYMAYHNPFYLLDNKYSKYHVVVETPDIVIRVLKHIS